MRKNFSNEFKVRAVIALLKEDKTASQLSGELGVHPGQLSQWKKMFLEHAQGAFQGKVK